MIEFEMRIEFFQVILLCYFCSALADTATATLNTQVESNVNVKPFNGHKHNWYKKSKHLSLPNSGLMSASSRDSYSDAPVSMGGYSMNSGYSGSGNQITSGSHTQATGTKYGAPADNSGQALTYHYMVYPGNQMQMGEYGSTGHDDDDGGDFGGGGGGGGEIGLLGLLGLKGLKGFKLFKLLKFGPILLPLLLPLLLPILLPLLLLGLPLLLIPLALLLIIPLGLLLLLPIPVITVGRRNLAREFEINEDCVERISCEVARYAKGFGFNPTWVQKLAEKNSTNKWIDRISRSVQNTNCATYTCNPVEKLQKSLKLKS